MQQILPAVKNGQASNIFRVLIRDQSDNNGNGKTGLAFNTASLIISTICDNEATPTVYTTAGSTIETVAVLGTYAAPTATKCRFAVVDATNHPGLYELHLADARFAISGAKRLAITIAGASDAAQYDAIIPLTVLDPNGSSGANTFASLTVTGTLTVSDGIAVTRSSSNTAAVTFTGNGTGHGLSLISGSGATGNACNMAANSTNGVGLNIAGVGTGAGIVSTGGATGHGASFVGGATSGNGLTLSTSTSGHGLSATGTGTTKHGIHAAGGSTTSHGINAVGGGVGHGILATSGTGATGDGIKAVAASTNGNGFNLVGVGTGAGLLSTGGATGHGINGLGGATSGDGLNVSAQTSGIGLSATGIGTTKAGAVFTGGATTSAGLLLVGGSTTGDGLKTTTTSGNGFNLTCTGSSMHGLLTTGGNGGTSDGIKAVAGTGGVPIRGNITGNITGTVDTVTTLTTVADIWGLTDGIETGFTPKQALRLIAAACAGKSSKSSNTRIYRSLTDAADRLTATTDSNGQRTAVSYSV